MGECRGDIQEVGAPQSPILSGSLFVWFLLITRIAILAAGCGWLVGTKTNLSRFALFFSQEGSGPTNSPHAAAEDSQRTFMEDSSSCPLPQ